MPVNENNRVAAAVTAATDDVHGLTPVSAHSLK
jgi:hypothetical protein